ncbi:MAG: hypothetical protein WCB31_07555 [Nitrososphaeraceae archaeon]
MVLVYEIYPSKALVTFRDKKKITCLYGTTFEDLDFLKFIKAKEYQHSQYMKMSFRLAVKHFLSGCKTFLVVDMYRAKICSVLGISFMKIECLLLQDSLDVLFPNMEKNIVRSDRGIRYPEVRYVIGLNHHLHSPTQKRLMQRVNQFLKIASSLLTITIIVFKKKKMNAIYFMYITGYNSLFQFTKIQ